MGIQRGKQVLPEPGNGFLEKVEWMTGVSGGVKIASLMLTSFWALGEPHKLNLFALKNNEER